MSSEKRRARLETINKKCKNQQISLLEAKQLLIEMLNVYAQYPVKSEAEISREELLLQGEIKPNEEELKLLEETYRLVPASIKQAENSLSEIRSLKQLTEDDIQKFIQLNKESVEK
ncbi:9115_t:CDS:2 [Entrophospora sp. SA101]|nr:7808_t:CDS:2 [Entrophospora sp. SA101]CAJ0824337.1 6869_t:CDS:2 [Entrophospora sp. SA101]CAJ0899305.1 9115_t:CDS:2 [Entrophospora sp. SA101]